MINKTLNKETFQVNWDYVLTLECFEKLTTTPHHSIWRSEGSPYQHTQMVVNEVYKLPEYESLTNEEKEILVLAALFHDIGKGKSTKLSQSPHPKG